MLGIRFYLHLANYPKVGGDSLHVAHMLWGGLLMLVALVLVIGWMGKPARRWAALLGGLGFGTFIDELGKFLTHDNDYFYRPTVALIYVLFVLLYLALRAARRGEPDQPTALANALQEVESAAMGDLDAYERGRALAWLARCDPDHPLVAPMRQALLGSELVAIPDPDPFERLRRWLAGHYRRAVQLPGFDRALLLFFLAQLALRVLHVGGSLAIGDGGVAGAGRWGWLDPGTVDDPGGFAAWGQLVSLGVGAALVGAGIVALRHSRVEAYRWLLRSVLVSIFLTQPFMFFRDEWAALGGLLFHLLLYFALRFSLEREREELSPSGTPPR